MTSNPLNPTGVDPIIQEILSVKYVPTPFCVIPTLNDAFALISPGSVNNAVAFIENHDLRDFFRAHWKHRAEAYNCAAARGRQRQSPNTITVAVNKLNIEIDLEF